MKEAEEISKADPSRASQILAIVEDLEAKTARVEKSGAKEELVEEIQEVEPALEPALEVIKAAVLVEASKKPEGSEKKPGAQPEGEKKPGAQPEGQPEVPNKDKDPLAELDSKTVIGEIKTEAGNILTGLKEKDESLTDDELKAAEGTVDSLGKKLSDEDKSAVDKVIKDVLIEGGLELPKPTGPVTQPQP